MNRFAQLYHGKVIYIYETVAPLDEVRQHFAPETIWYDVTTYPEVQIGYIQGFKQDGSITLIPDVSNNTDTLSDEEKRLSFLLSLKMKMYQYLDTLAQNYEFIDFKEALSFLNSNSRVDSERAKTLDKKRLDLLYKIKNDILPLIKNKRHINMVDFTNVDKSIETLRSYQ